MDWRRDDSHNGTTKSRSRRHRISTNSGGRDRHFCIGCMDIQPLMDALDANKIEYTKSKSGRQAIFFKDPDSNTLEVVEGLEWHV